jgi:hypothetical protein
MRALPLLGALAVSAVPAAAQVAVPHPLGALLEHRPSLEVRPGLALLRCCAAERRVDLRLQWPAELDRRSANLALFGLLASTGRGYYSASGVEALGSLPEGPITLNGAVRVGAGTGVGPGSMLSLTVGAGAPGLELDIRTTWFRDAPSDTAPDGSPIPGGFAPARFDGRYTDGELRARRRLAIATVQVTGGMRFGGEAPTPPQWLWAELAVPVRPPVQLVLAGGTRPERPDLAQAGGRFAQLAIRFDVGNPAEPTTVAAEPEPDPATAAVAVAPGRYRLRLRLPGARSVEIKGDLTDWQVVALRHADGAAGAWEVLLDRPAGLYHLNVRVDGGAWRVPAGLPAVPDRFGGTTGLIDLPPFQEAHDAEA